MTQEEAWLVRVRAWRASGLSAKDYCRDQAFGATTLLTWSSRLGRAGKIAKSRSGRKKTKRDAAPSVTFARVVGATRRAAASSSITSELASAPTPAPRAMTIAVGASRIEVSHGFDASLLRAVVEALAGDAR